MSKYNNRRCELDNYVFDSQAEGNYYLYLRAAKERGAIADLRIHPRYLLLEGFTYTDDGEEVRERPIYYEADFSYTDKGSGELVVADVKGVETEAFKIKAKLFRQRYPEKRLCIVKV